MVFSLPLHVMIVFRSKAPKKEEIVWEDDGYDSDGVGSGWYRRRWHTSDDEDEDEEEERNPPPKRRRGRSTDWSSSTLR